MWELTSFRGATKCYLAAADNALSIPWPRWMIRKGVDVVDAAGNLSDHVDIAFLQLLVKTKIPLPIFFTKIFLATSADLSCF